MAAYISALSSKWLGRQMKPLYLLLGYYVSSPQVLLTHCLGRLQNELWGHESVLENSC